MTATKSVASDLGDAGTVTVTCVGNLTLQMSMVLSLCFLVVREVGEGDGKEGNVQTWWFWRYLHCIFSS